MALGEEMQRSGDWLFTHRSYMPLGLVGILIVGMLQFEYPQQRHDLQEMWCHVCLAVSLAGLAVRGYVVGHVCKGTSGRNTSRQVATELNTTGLYSIVRHPLYLGNFLIWLGIGLFSGIWWLVLIEVLAFWVYYERIMLAEEAFLIQKFGARYTQWADRTPAFIPQWRQWRRPDLPFSFKNVLRREYTGLFGILSAFTLLELGEHWVVESQVRLDPEWQAVGLLGLAMFLALRFLKRHTAWLEVQGR